ncbi:MAG: hypothetical protein RR512_03225 [Coprobacillus sp.]
MEYLFIILATFIGMLLLMQMILFEITRSKMVKADNVNWYLSLNRSFSYNRVGYMVFVCLICYLISSPEAMFSTAWFIYLILFIAMGIVSDAIVQYLILKYGKQRCKREIQEAILLQNELEQISQTLMNDESFDKTPEQYDEKEILKKYVEPTDHLAILSVDAGRFAKEYSPIPEAAFVVEPYAAAESVKDNLIDTPYKATKLTPSGQMPFKDEKLDVVMCQYSNYDKFEVQRILKKDGYFVVNQNGTANLKEFLKIYMPFGMKGSWDAFSCAQTLEDIEMKIIEKLEDYGTIRFHNLNAVHTYFKNNSPDLGDINKYKIFYLKALKEIKEKSFYEVTTHRFLIVAQKI